MVLLRLVFRVFFARADVLGRQWVPKGGPLFVVVNHPNALVDALCMQVLSPRPVAMLAKSTLFTMPVIGQLVRAMGSLPVYRRQDGEAQVGGNAQTFAAARQLLQAGRALCIFPEGASHDGGMMLPLKTGAARMALGAGAGLAASEPAVSIVPASLMYTDKGTFRSRVLLQFGPPLRVPQVALHDGEPPPQAVRALTHQMAEALAALTVQHALPELLPLFARAAEIVDQHSGGRPALAARKLLLQRLVAGHRRLVETHPAATSQLIEAVRAYDATLVAAGLPAHADLAAPSGPLMLALLWPLALPGILLHYPAYRAIGRLALARAHGQEDMLATLKVMAGLVLFPLTYLAAAVALWPLLVGPWHLLLCLMPLTGYAALLLAQACEGRAYRRRARATAQTLADSRRSIHAQLMALAEKE